MKQHVAEQLMLIEFAFRESGREMRSVNRNVELLEYIRQRAQVVFVTMCENYCRDVVAILFEKIKVRNGDINAVRSLFGKAHAGVEDQHLVAVTHDHTIHPKLADTAERD